MGRIPVRRISTPARECDRALLLQGRLLLHDVLPGKQEVSSCNAGTVCVFRFCTLPHHIGFCRFRSNGGIVQKRKLHSLNEVSDSSVLSYARVQKSFQLDGLADVIVNCSGLASYHLVGDTSVYPIRGQVYKVILSVMVFSGPLKTGTL